MEPIDRVKDILTTVSDTLTLSRRLKVAIMQVWYKVFGKSKPLAGLAFDITVLEANGDTKQAPSNQVTQLRYGLEPHEKETRIVPTIGYLTALTEGGPIGPIRLPGEPFSWDWPTLDIKVVNNSGQTVVLSRADFVVRRSVSNLDPVPLFADLGQHLALRMAILNEGWGTIANGQLHFNLLPYAGVTEAKLLSLLDFEQPYVHELNLDAFTTEIDVDLSEALEKEGVDVAVIRSTIPGAQFIWPDAPAHNAHHVSANESIADNAEGADDVRASEAFRAFGKFKSGGAVIFGEMSYSWNTNHGERRDHCVRFYNTVWLFEKPGTGRGLYPTEDYDIALHIDADNYSVMKPISQILLPGDGDRFTVRVMIPRSSEHWFNIKLRYNGKQTITSEPMYLRAFVPRTGAPEENDDF